MVVATLGGGVSSLQGDLGLLIDSLESVQLVTANGSYVPHLQTRTLTFSGVLEALTPILASSHMQLVRCQISSTMEKL